MMAGSVTVCKGHGGKEWRSWATWTGIEGEGEEKGEGAGECADGGSVTGWRSDCPANEEAGTLLRLGNKGGRLESPGRVPTSLLRAGEGAVDRQGWLLGWPSTGEGVISHLMTALSTAMDASLRFIKTAGPSESDGAGGIGHLPLLRLP